MSEEFKNKIQEIVHTTQREIDGELDSAKEEAFESQDPRLRLKIYLQTLGEMSDRERFLNLKPEDSVGIVSKINLLVDEINDPSIPRFTVDSLAQTLYVSKKVDLKRLRESL